MFLSAQIVFVFGQQTTNISGMINYNLTLTKSNSPYLATGDIVVFPNWKLTIEPGVEFRFAKDVKIQIRGSLEALGTAAEPIFFISDIGNSQADIINMNLWQGIEIKNNLGGKATFNYCNFSHATEAIKEENGGGVDAIKNSRFTLNDVAISYGGGKEFVIENCYFANNCTCVMASSKIINCVFENNEYGLYKVSNDVLNSTFTNHTQIAVWGGYAKMTNCIITNNNLGYRPYNEGFIVDKCDISNNQIGMEVDVNNIASITNTKVCNNLQYNVVNRWIYDVDLYGICWCTSDSATVENLIFDAYDSIWLGIINYTIFDDDCSKAIYKTHKAEGTIEYLNTPDLTNNKTIIYPNPASSSLFIENLDNINNIQIYDYTGRLLMDRFVVDNDIIELNVSQFTSGLYIVKLENQNNSVEFKRIMIAR